MSGVFLALAALSKEVALVFALVFFIFLAVKKFKRQLIYVFIPFIILLMILWLPSVLSGQNRYLSLFSTKVDESNLAHLHIFPDPYTYYFEKNEFLEQFKHQNLGLVEDLEAVKNLTNFGFEGIGFGGRLKVGGYILLQHLSRFFSLEEFGGPFIALLLVLGLVYLKKRDNFLYKLSFYWLIVSLLVFSFILLVGRSHLIDFIWLLILLVALGLLYLTDIVKKYFNLSSKAGGLLDAAIIVLVIYHLILVDHVALGERYNDDFVPRSLTYARQIKSLDIKDTEVIAIPNDFSGQSDTLNYLTDKSFVIFQSSTLTELLKENKIKQAFDFFGVKYILGYEEDLSRQLAEQAGVIDIADRSLKVNIEEVSSNKSFLMNIIR